jgi:SAM-dependent methyltransferase
VLKDYIATKEISDDDEISFVESYWSDKFAGLLPDAEKIGSLARREEYRRIEPYLGRLPRGARVMDAGCGAGEWTVFLASKGYDVVGMDISRSLIGELNRKFPNLNFVRGDIRATGLPADGFDALISWGVFEHFEVGLSPGLKEAWRILKPGGMIFASVPFANRRQRRRRDSDLRKQTAAGIRNCRFYQWRITRAEFAFELALAGFQARDILPIGKDEGLRRMLAHDLHLRLEPGSLLETLLLRVLSMIIPASYVSHMLLAIGEKGSS